MEDKDGLTDSDKVIKEMFRMATSTAKSDNKSKESEEEKNNVEDEEMDSDVDELISQHMFKALCK